MARDGVSLREGDLKVRLQVILPFLWPPLKAERLLTANGYYHHCKNELADAGCLEAISDKMDS